MPIIIIIIIIFIRTNGTIVITYKQANEINTDTTVSLQRTYMSIILYHISLWIQLQTNSSLICFCRRKVYRLSRSRKYQYSAAGFTQERTLSLTSRQCIGLAIACIRNIKLEACRGRDTVSCHDTMCHDMTSARQVCWAKRILFVFLSVCMFLCLFVCRSARKLNKKNLAVAIK